MAFFIFFLCTVSLFFTAYAETNQCSGPEVSLSINPDADVKFTVILSLREPTVDHRCGSKWSDVALQSVGVIQWAVERINNGSYIQGVKLGEWMLLSWHLTGKLACCKPF